MSEPTQEELKSELEALKAEDGAELREIADRQEHEAEIEAQLEALVEAEPAAPVYREHGRQGAEGGR